MKNYRSLIKYFGTILAVILLFAVAEANCQTDRPTIPVNSTNDSLIYVHEYPNMERELMFFYDPVSHRACGRVPFGGELLDYGIQNTWSGKTTDYIGTWYYGESIEQFEDGLPAMFWLYVINHTTGEHSCRIYISEADMSYSINNLDDIYPAVQNSFRFQKTVKRFEECHSMRHE